MVKCARQGNLRGMQKNEPEINDCEPLELFESIAPTQALALKIEAGAVRLRRPHRKQLELRAQDLESLLSEGHRARLVWGYVERQDLSALHAKIKAREGTVGRHAVDPRVLFALWLYATLEGVSSARELARLTQEHDAYRWICGGIELSYRTLAKWRVRTMRRSMSCSPTTWRRWPRWA